MSDLQDIIARNAVIAYNQGFERGEASERERIADLLTDLKSEFTRKEELERYLAVAVKRINESR